VTSIKNFVDKTSKLKSDSPFDGGASEVV